MLHALSEYSPRKQRYIEAKNGAFRKCKQKFTRGEKNLLKCLKTE